jgi:hypothetical protein
VNAIIETAIKKIYLTEAPVVPFHHPWKYRTRLVGVSADRDHRVYFRIEEFLQVLRTVTRTYSPPKSDVPVPFFANLRQIIGPYIGRATSVGAECNDDIVVWELGFKVSLC